MHTTLKHRSLLRPSSGTKPSYSLLDGRYDLFGKLHTVLL